MTMNHRVGVYCIIFAAAFFAAGCERLGIEDPAKVAAERETEGKAIGAGCRHTGRSLEDCYGLNERALKAAVFSGWKEMNDYMVSNKMEAIPSKLVQAAGAEQTAAAAPAEAAKADGPTPPPHPTERH